MERPGGGEQIIYFPFGVNATLYCIVEATLLIWGINGDSYTESESSLNPRGIYFEIMPRTSAGIIESYIKVFGNRVINDSVSICCQSIAEGAVKMACTMLIFYGMYVAKHSSNNN